MTIQPTPPKILPPHYFLLALFGIGLCRWLLPVLSLPPAVRWLGVPSILIGIGMAVAGSRLFARAGTSIIPLTRSTTLVTQGVFRFTRNPMYAGMIATLAGAALLAQSWWAGLIVVGFFLLIRQSFVLREEQLLVETFGEDYEAYRRRVRRWL